MLNKAAVREVSAARTLHALAEHSSSSITRIGSSVVLLRQVLLDKNSAVQELVVRPSAMLLIYVLCELDHTGQHSKFSFQGGSMRGHSRLQDNTIGVQ